MTDAGLCKQASRPIPLAHCVTRTVIGPRGETPARPFLTGSQCLDLRNTRLQAEARSPISRSVDRNQEPACSLAFPLGRSPIAAPSLAALNYSSFDVVAYRCPRSLEREFRKRSIEIRDGKRCCGRLALSDKFRQRGIESRQSVENWGNS